MATVVWYYSKNGQRLGPFGFTQLRQMAAAGVILPHDHVLREGDADWQKAADVPGLFPPGQAQPQPTPDTQGTAAPAPEPGLWGTFTGSLEGVFRLTAKIAGWGCGTLFVLYAVLMIGVGLWKNTQKSNPPQPDLPLRVTFRTSDVGKGMVMQVTNTSGAPLKDISFSVTSVGGKEAGQIVRVIRAPIKPNDPWEIGWMELDGWELRPGETVKIWHSTLNYKPLVVTVPVKAAGR